MLGNDQGGTAKGSALQEWTGLCLGDIAVPYLEILNTFVDLVGILDFVGEDIVFALPEMAIYHSFWVLDDVTQPAVGHVN